VKRALLFTGGLDSVMLWRRTNPVELVYVMQPGSPYLLSELTTICNLCEMEPRLRVLTIEGADWPEPEDDGHVPHRNLGLIVQVAAVTGAQRLYLGSVRGESSPDKSRAFLRAASQALSASEHADIRVEAPLRRQTKAWHLSEHLRRWPEDYELLAATRSCYAETGRCGECLACFRRWVAFKLAGMPAEEHRRAPWERSWDTRSAVKRYALGTTATEWRGMLANHRDAQRALRLQRQEAT
jgi:Queuosine biosynthesis protein QueC